MKSSKSFLGAWPRRAAISDGRGIFIGSKSESTVSDRVSSRHRGSLVLAGVLTKGNRYGLGGGDANRCCWGGE